MEDSKINAGDWREKWEDAAKAERAQFDSWSISELLDRVRCRQFGDYYTIWYSISSRSTLHESGWMLLDVLEHRSYDYLYRYHAAAALIELMDTNRWQPIEISAEGHEGFDERLRDFKRDVMTAIMKSR